MSRVVAVVLAAGGGSPSGAGHKLLAVLDGRTIIEHAVGAAHEGVGEVIVVSGAVELPPRPVDTPGIRIVEHPGWAAGQATSLATALAACDDDVAAVVVGLGDQPGVPAQAWRAVSHSEAAMAIATYDGHRRNPVLLRRDVWPLLPTTGDEGARVLARLRPDLVEEVPCTGSPDDIDTLEDLARWQSKSSTNSR